jgi:hypothetical protein
MMRRRVLQDNNVKTSPESDREMTYNRIIHEADRHFRRQSNDNDNCLIKTL